LRHPGCQTPARGAVACNDFAQSGELANRGLPERQELVDDKRVHVSNSTAPLVSKMIAISFRWIGVSLNGIG